MIYQLIYTGSLRSNLGTDEMAAIATHAKSRNASNGITGVLLCHDGSILQVLEGERQVVLDTYARINDDDRIRNLLVLVSRETPAREFPQWSMGLRHVTQATRAAEIFALSPNTLEDVLPNEPSLEVRTIGKTFARVNGLARYA